MMISTYDLTLLGSLVTAGGLALLRQGKWPHLNVHWRSGSKRTIELSAEYRDEYATVNRIGRCPMADGRRIDPFYRLRPRRKRRLSIRSVDRRHVPPSVRFHLLGHHSLSDQSGCQSIDCPFPRPATLERLRQHQLDFLYGRDDTSGVLLYAAAQDKDDIPA